MAVTPKIDGSRQAAAEIAEYICARFREGYRGAITLGACSFELTDVARCSEFVRECIEAAWGCGDHNLSTSAAKPAAGPFFGGTARETEKLLAARAVTGAQPRRGDIVCFNAHTGEFGHIGLCLGDGRFAENTSSTKRGPGFVVSKLADMATRISGYYIVLPPRAQASPHDPPLLIGQAGETITGRMIDGKLWTPARETLAAAGKGIVWHPEQGKGYVVDPEVKK